MTDPPAPEDQLASLVRHAQAGDPEAFSHVVRRCHPLVYRWALGRTGDADDADDVAQEVLVRLHSHLTQYSGEARFTTWLYRVTANAALALHRRESARGRLAERVAADRTADAAPARAAEQAEASELASAALTLYAALPDQQRAVFDLVDLQGHAPSEAADMLEMNRSTLRVHLLRARRALRGKLLELYPTLLEDRV